MLEPDTFDVATPAVQLRVLSVGDDAPMALCLHGFPTRRTGGARLRRCWSTRAGGWSHRSCGATRRRRSPGQQLPRRCADGRCAAGARRGRRDGAARRDHRARLGHGGRGARRDAGQPVREGGGGIRPPHRSARRVVGYPMSAALSRRGPRNCCEAVHPVLPVALAAENVPPNGWCPARLWRKWSPGYRAENTAT